MQINCPAPLPEGPRTALLMAMLTEAPYVVPEKKEKKEEKKKEARDGLRPRGPPDARSEDTHAPSAHEGEKVRGEDGGDGGSSPTKKRAASEDAGESLPLPAPKRPCRAKVALSDDNSASAEHSEASAEVPRRTRRTKPRAQRYMSRYTLSTLGRVVFVIDRVPAF